MEYRSVLRKLTKLRLIVASSPKAIGRFGRRWLGLPRPAELYYVVPDAGWSIDWDGHYITSGIAAQFGWHTHVTSAPYLLVDHIVHYGELGSFVGSLGTRRNRLNTIVMTIFHGTRAREFPHLAQNTEQLVDNLHVPVRIVTSCRIMERRLIAWGASPERVCCIPLGVDLSLFRPASQQDRFEMRRRLGIPGDVFCIGSFQKDGVGWGEGMTPKPVKGPDVFLQVVERLHKQYKLFVLLTAPARGYVKQGLESLGVAYKHVILSDYMKIVSYYHCLDLYLVASREEGGPKAVLESMATGVPLVSTRVGLAPDVVHHGQNGFLADVEDTDSLAAYVARVIEEPELRCQLARNGLVTIAHYDWSHIAARYYRNVYLPLLQAEMS